MPVRLRQHGVDVLSFQLGECGRRTDGSPLPLIAPFAD